MYAFIEGTLESVGDVTVVSAGGIGWELHLGQRQQRALPAVGQVVRLHTHLNVREDDLTLFGFGSPQEREVFRALLSVNGVGPKVALSVVGSEDAGPVLHGIRLGDPKPLLAIKGIGRKTAERVVLELKDRAAAWVGLDERETAAGASSSASGPAAEAVLALQSLGVHPDRAARAVASVLESGPVPGVEELLRGALRELHPGE